MTTFEKVQKAIADEIGEDVKPDTRLVTLVTDSLEMASLIQVIEDALGKEIDDCDLRGIFTVQDVVNFAEAH